MTAEQHNKYVALTHLANASFQLLMMAFMGVMFGIMISLDPGPNPPPPAFFVVMFLFVGFFVLLFSLPSLFAAYGFWKRKSWAKTMGIVAGVCAAMHFPFGIAACIYTFWFLFSDPGKELYDKPRNMLPPAPPSWPTPEFNSQTADYARRTPPDWR